MSNALAVLNPFDIFIGADGLPLNGGYIYVGVAGQDPELFPVQLYWDVAGTLPATQPLRTLQGYLSNAGAPARIAVNGNYSLRVRDKNGAQVYFEPNVALLSSQTSFTLGGGTAAVPTYGFSGGAGTGMYSPAANQIAWSGAGVQRMLMDASGAFTINEPGAGPALTANGSTFSPGVYALGQNVAGQSFGLQIDGGTTVADYALLVRNRGATQTLARIRGDGSFLLGNNAGTTILGSSGLDLTGRGQALCRFKPATTTITNNSVLADDPSLSAALGAATWAFELWLPVWATAANSLKWQMNFTGTQTSFFASAQYTAGGVASQTAIVAPPGALSFALVVAASETGADWLIIKGTITVTVTGTLSFQEAQNTSNANSVNIGKGAWMKVTQVS